MDMQVTEAPTVRLDHFLPHQLHVAREEVSKFITREHLAKHRLNEAAWEVICALGHLGEATPTEITHFIQSDKLRVNRVMATLNPLRMISTKPNPKDARSIIVSLTQKGRAVYRSAPEMVSAVDAVLSEGLSKAEWTALHKALLKLGEHVRSLNEGDAE